MEILVKIKIRNGIKNRNDLNDSVYNREKVIPRGFHFTKSEIGDLNI